MEIPATTRIAALTGLMFLPGVGQACDVAFDPAFLTHQLPNSKPNWTTSRPSLKVVSRADHLAVDGE